jgi:hypothetical protein
VNQLADRERERILWLLDERRPIRDVERISGHSKVTVARLIECFHAIALTAGWPITGAYREWDRYYTQQRLPLNGRLRAAMNPGTPFPLVQTRALLAQARDEERAQRLIDVSLPLIRSCYGPTMRKDILIEEVMRDEGAAPSYCHHCGGLYSHLRHAEICVRFGLV